MMASSLHRFGDPRSEFNPVHLTSGAWLKSTLTSGLQPGDRLLTGGARLLTGLLNGWLVRPFGKSPEPPDGQPVPGYSPGSFQLLSTSMIWPHAAFFKCFLQSSAVTFYYKDVLLRCFNSIQVPAFCIEVLMSYCPFLFSNMLRHVYFYLTDCLGRIS